MQDCKIKNTSLKCGGKKRAFQTFSNSGSQPFSEIGVLGHNDNKMHAIIYTL